MTGKNRFPKAILFMCSANEKNRNQIRFSLLLIAPQYNSMDFSVILLETLAQHELLFVY